MSSVLSNLMSDSFKKATLDINGTAQFHKQYYLSHCSIFNLVEQLLQFHSNQ